MSKIVIVSSSKENKVGGVERFCNLLKEVLKNDFEVEVIGKEDIKNFLFYKIFSKVKGLDTILLSYFLGKCADKLKPDLVITNGPFGFSTKIKSLNVQHGTFADASDKMDKNLIKKFIRKHLWGFVERKAAQKAKKVIAVSNWTKNAVVKYYKIDQSKIEVILNAIDINVFKKLDKFESRKKLNLPLYKKLILFVGRLSYQKSPEIIFELAKKFEKEDIYFVLVTNKNPFWNLKNIFIFQNIPNNQLPFFYSACDIFILPSKYEGCPFTLIEAMACKIPFVVTNVGCVPEILNQFPELGFFVVNELSPESFYYKIKEIFAMDTRELEILIEKGYNFILNNCSIDSFRKKYLEIIKNILKQND